jgi:uncharacterized glyoxalase superfamily protein PhnB
MHVPPGFTQVFPYIFAADAARYLTFLADGLGGEIGPVHTGPDGKVANAQVRFGDTTIMVSEQTAGLGAMRATYYLYVEDADAAMARAVRAGGVQLNPVMDQTYGERQGGVTDPAGNIWWLSQRLSAGPYEG